jgi:hypothetical protein
MTKWSKEEAEKYLIGGLGDTGVKTVDLTLCFLATTQRGIQSFFFFFTIYSVLGREPT